MRISDWSSDVCSSDLYNKPTQEGMYQHFKTVVEAVDLPKILYNVPGRTGADLAHDTLARLARVPDLVGVKNATGNIDRVSALLRQVPQDFLLITGHPPTAPALILLGARGNISVKTHVHT